MPNFVQIPDPKRLTTVSGLSLVLLLNVVKSFDESLRSSIFLLNQNEKRRCNVIGGIYWNLQLASAMAAVRSERDRGNDSNLTNVRAAASLWRDCCGPRSVRIDVRGACDTIGPPAHHHRCAGTRGLFGISAQRFDAFTISTGSKKVRSTAPMLMYQHSFSGTSYPG